MQKSLIVSLVLTVTLAFSALAEVPNQMSYQGRLTDPAGDPVSDGTYSILFRIWDAGKDGTALWSSGIRQIEVQSGLFSYNLGDTIKIDPALFQSNPDLWVGVKVGFDPELFPRTKLTSVGYAYEADHASRTDHADTADFAAAIDWTDGDSRYVNLTGDVMTGSLVTTFLDLGTASTTNGMLEMFSSAGPTAIITAGPMGVRGGQIHIKGQNTKKFIRLEPDVDTDYGGYFAVARNSNNQYGFEVDGNYNGTHEPSIWITGTSRSTNFNMSFVGDASVALPDDAISADEILDEPGIAFQRNSSLITFTQGAGSMTDIETVTITTPASGYIVVRAEIVGYTVGSTGANFGQSQIDQSAGGGLQAGHYQYWGHYGATNQHYNNVSHTRIYYKIAGTHTFRVEGIAYASNGSGAITRTTGAWMLATYYPTSYGSVATVAANPGDYDNARTQSVEDQDGNITTVYEVDLRDLEIRATRARLEAERLERELAQAQFNKQNEASDIK